MLQEPIYGANLTRRLQEEREAILFKLAKREKSLHLLFESSSNELARWQTLAGIV